MFPRPTDLEEQADKKFNISVRKHREIPKDNEKEEMTYIIQLI